MIYLLFRFELKVTLILQSLFWTYTIKNILGWNCADIMQTLSKAMSKPHNINNKLNLVFEGEIDKYLIKLLMLNNYKNKIISLYLNLYGSEQVLLEPSLTFDMLETLSIKARKEAHRGIIETMLSKHANTLTTFILVDCFETLDDLTVPSLPGLKSIKLRYLSNTAAFSLLRACKQSVTSLNIQACGGTPPSNEIPDLSNYYLPNLRDLKIREGHQYCMYDEDLLDDHNWNFLIHNAKNLESMSLKGYVKPGLQIPDLPKLKEFEFGFGRGHLPILEKCKETLQCLHIGFYNSSDEFFSDLPKLTTLFLSGSRHRSKFLSSNKESLEFLHIDHIEPGFNLGDSVKLENMKNVVLNYTYCECSNDMDQDRVKMQELCSNANVIIVINENRKNKRSYFRKNGFTADNWNDKMMTV